jgi:hypothetical protein
VPGPHFFGFPPELFDGGALGPELFEAAKGTAGFVSTVFPNFSFLAFPFHHVRSAGPVATLVLHLWEPTAAGEMVVWTWAMCPKGTTEEFRRESYRTTMGTFSGGGTFEADDTDPWMAIARSAGATYARKAALKADVRMGMGGAGVSKRAYDYPDPGIAYFNVLEEGASRGFHRRWLQFMRAEHYPPPMTAEEQDADTGGPSANGHG